MTVHKRRREDVGIETINLLDDDSPAKKISVGAQIDLNLTGANVKIKVENDSEIDVVFQQGVVQNVPIYINALIPSNISGQPNVTIQGVYGENVQFVVSTQPNTYHHAPIITCVNQLVERPTANIVTHVSNVQTHGSVGTVYIIYIVTQKPVMNSL